ncbi:hypothetical protein [Ktedonospora formicarum]|uniref:Uncharacterized protein n=1 Tax=Ktedonospora formicarum TaxID=2778364 RepID=A0A8J3IE64_9CHLR|nr:hypothetical protein [Ktedonospora formicarum]GHO50359.1 hypothetical protein KSX_85220 [Ktedonospora formicarum]
MWSQYALSERERQAGEQLSQETTGHLVTLLTPLLEVLDTLLDTCLVRTLFETVQALIVWRDASKAMLLSELGAFLASPAHAPAGTKRLSRLLHSPCWHARVIEHFLWTQASQAIASLKSQGETPLLVWDESVLEKPESLTLEGLGSVRSSQAFINPLEAPSSCQACNGSGCWS